jgi:hypothetical protein
MTARATALAPYAPRTRTEIRRAAPAPDVTQQIEPCTGTDSIARSSSDRRFASPYGWGGEAIASPPAAAGTMGSTLEILIQRLWEGLWAGGAPCPLCGGQLRLDNGRGVCNRCGSALS